MSRLQKKCVIGTAGIHLLLLILLVVGPAFFSPKPKMDDTQVLEVIPANVIDAAFNNGKRDATPPPPEPVTVPQPPPPQTHQEQQPAPKPPEPTPEPSIIKRIENAIKPEPKPEAKPEPPKPAPKATVNKPHEIQVNSTVTTRNAVKNNDSHSQRDTRILSRAITSLKKNLSKGTEIDMPGNSTEAYANYASVVRSVYDAAWILPNTIAKDENIKVSVTIARDGTVISSRIITPSGDAPADDSVQRTLDRVTFIKPFPEGSTDKERTYTIVFNPQVKGSE